MHQRDADADGLDALSYLVKLYGFEAPLESAVSVAPGICELLDLGGRHKTNLILHDLVALGVPLGRVLEIPHCQIVAFDDLRVALGWLYVSERCLDAYVRSAWHDELTCALDVAAATSDDEDVLVDAAVRAFVHRDSWLRTSFAQPPAWIAASCS